MISARWALYKCEMVISRQAFSGILNNFRSFDNDFDSRPFMNGTFGCGLYMAHLDRLVL